MSKFVALLSFVIGQAWFKDIFSVIVDFRQSVCFSTRRICFIGEIKATEFSLLFIQFLTNAWIYHNVF